MAFRVGITTDLEVAKWELEQQFKNTRSWQATDPFPDQKTAQEWEKKKAAELGCKTVRAIKTPPRRKVHWYGILFEHDGPKHGGR